jgi:hypothetical protein
MNAEVGTVQGGPLHLEHAQHFVPLAIGHTAPIAIPLELR